MSSSTLHPSGYKYTPPPHALGIHTAKILVTTNLAINCKIAQETPYFSSRAGLCHPLESSILLPGCSIGVCCKSYAMWRAGRKVIQRSLSRDNDAASAQGVVICDADEGSLVSQGMLGRKWPCMLFCYWAKNIWGDWKRSNQLHLQPPILLPSQAPAG
jgi:hypothetical protein